MKTDGLFYRLLQAEPTQAFELAGVRLEMMRECKACLAMGL